METIKTDSTIGKLDLGVCMMNASGCNCQFHNDLDMLSKSHSGAIVSKSCTVNERIGNSIPRYFHNDKLSINSMGLPNQGYKYYLEYNKTVHKPYIMSVSSQALYTDISIFDKILASTVDGIELNISCPNIEGDSQLSYDFLRLDSFLRQLFERYDFNKKTIGLKLSPFFDTGHFNRMFNILNEYKNLDFLTCINGIGNGLYIDIDTEEPVIKPKNGLGGLGGSIVKPIGLSNVNMFYKNTNFDIIGCGGIECGKDIFEYILCGAKAVQIGTQLVREGDSCFERLDNELKETMYDKAYHNLHDFRGKLKYK